MLPEGLGLLVPYTLVTHYAGNTYLGKTNENSGNENARVVLGDLKKTEVRHVMLQLQTPYWRTPVNALVIPHKQMHRGIYQDGL